MVGGEGLGVGRFDVQGRTEQAAQPSHPSHKIQYPNTKPPSHANALVDGPRAEHRAALVRLHLHLVGRVLDAVPRQELALSWDDIMGCKEVGCEFMVTWVGGSIDGIGRGQGG